MNPRWTAVLVLIGFGFLVSVPATWSADYDPDSPAGIIDRYGDETVETLNNEELTKKDDLSRLRDQLFDQVAPIIDFRLLTRSALGPEARSITSEELERLVEVFRPLVVRLYSGRLMDYLVKTDNPWIIDKIVIEGQEMRGNGRYALVRTNAHVHRDSTERTLSMNFKMIRGDERWMVYDLVFENVSLVENYRSQFTSVLSNHSVDYLVDQLKTKLEQIRAGDAPDTAVTVTG